jgi:hypothetical protein
VSCPRRVSRAWSRGRLVDAVRLSIEVLFDIDRWSIVTTVAVAALVLAGAWGSRRVALFSATALVLVVSGGAWITAAIPELPVTDDEAVNPIVRYTGAAVLLTACLVPFALASVWSGSSLPRISSPLPRNRGSRPVMAVVTTALVGYLAIAHVGGAPAFPSRDECARVATSDADGELELVYGRLDSPIEAGELRDRVVSAGFVGTEVEADGCGRWKVANDGIDSFEQGQGTIAEARRAGFDPRLEVDPDS